LSHPGLPALVDALRGRRLFLLGGAGLSTASGIPDYRSPERLAQPRRPIQGPEFERSAAVRQRYWARSFRGWPQLAAAAPNPGHVALAALEPLAVGLVTQNVDGLHQRAGSTRLIELHGALEWVRCLRCGGREPRAAVQERLAELNPERAAEVARAAPDGDAELSDAQVAGFVVPACGCGGVLKPDVVFFGDSVPPARVEAAYAWVEACEAMVVVGSSLTVFSGFRFVRRAAELGRPVHILNRGPTRGDALATSKLEAPLEALLPALASALSAGRLPAWS
jgi:NAD-dependent SIR2 family protein deacetylase